MTCWPSCTGRLRLRGQPALGYYVELPQDEEECELLIFGAEGTEVEFVDYDDSWITLYDATDTEH